MPVRIVGKALTGHTRTHVLVLLHAEQTDDAQFVVAGKGVLVGDRVIPHPVLVVTFAARGVGLVHAQAVLRVGTRPVSVHRTVVLRGELRLERQVLDRVVGHVGRDVVRPAVALVLRILILNEGIHTAARAVREGRRHTVGLVAAHDRGDVVGVEQRVVAAVVDQIVRHVGAHAHLRAVLDAVFEADVGRQAVEVLRTGQTAVTHVTHTERIGGVLRRTRGREAVVHRQSVLCKLTQPVVVLAVLDVTPLVGRKEGVGRER